MRLNLFLAKCGIASRRQADTLIKQGRVLINGRAVLEPFLSVTENDRVEFEGKKLLLQNYIYLIINKPKGVTVTLKDKYAYKNVIDLLPEKIPLTKKETAKRKGIYPVGRLDKNSSGLLILTNDGDFCHKVTHPKFKIEKEYILWLKGSPKDDFSRRARQGLNVEGDFLKVKRIKIISKTSKTSSCSVIISEGKKRHLRRLFKALGFLVVDLKRIRIGKLVLGKLKPGEFRSLEREYIYSLTFAK